MSDARRTSEDTAGEVRAQVPNVLTASRIGLGVVFPFLPVWAWIPVCVVAGITEFFDGYLARRWNVESQLGRMLDPVADKVFLAGVLVAFVVGGYITVVELLLVGIRDLVVIAGWIVLLAMGRRDVILRLRPRLPGKTATWFQYGFMLFVLIWLVAPALLVGVTAVASFVAAVDYLRYFVREQRRVEIQSSRTG